MNFQIRVALSSDLAAINAIYNHYVALSTCTYQLVPSNDRERGEWFSRHERAGLPVTVAIGENTVVGWGALSAFHDRGGFQFTLEDSVYGHPDHLQKGIGRALLADLLKRAEELRCRSIMAVISGDQLPSIRLHARAGFEEVGRLREAGFKFGRWLDVVYMQTMMERVSGVE